ncbi:DUF1836 domain-containing protein [Bacillus sp. FJAT-42376]|uniref:DUF1836 domain-containing protein n=1 Tax=Bacillus sp. FJAT-42376 TaxID=2014076 RepID=UPI000F515A95|nr:DUF1836 domain-containing protein [Bacillus sp. FJAT-42376]AZB42518.1 DUF1836 domain-containing protein [Bacillus sp. FJAT-42376]
MKELKLTRLEMSGLLHALDLQNGLELENFLSNWNRQASANLPEFVKRFKRSGGAVSGLSTNDIVALGNLCELTTFKSTSIQNWIKRDIKGLIGQPELGKKYSIDQAVILLIVRDLKSTYDFETIRKMLNRLFNTLSDRTDDLISPVDYYEAYAVVLDKLIHESFHFPPATDLEEKIEAEAEIVRTAFPSIPDSSWIRIKPVLVLTVFSVLYSHLLSKAQQYQETHLNFS